MTELKIQRKEKIADEAFEALSRIQSITVLEHEDSEIRMMAADMVKELAELYKKALADLNEAKTEVA